MRIAAVVLNYNDSEDTIFLVEKIVNYNNIDNIVVVDNCSTDDSYILLQQNLSKYDKVHIVLLDINGGYGAGNNKGIQYANDILKCDYALVVNPDVRFEEDLIEQLMKVMENNKNCCLCGCKQINPDNRNIVQAWKIPASLVEYVIGWGHLLQRFWGCYYYQPNYFEHGLKLVDCIQGALLFFDIEKFWECGGYDEDIFLYCEETSLGLRIKKRGYTTLLDCDSNYLHLHSKSIGKAFPNWNKKYRLIRESRQIVARKNWSVNAIEYRVIKVCSFIAYYEDYLCNKMRECFGKR